MEIKDLDNIKATLLEGEPTSKTKKKLSFNDIETAKQLAINAPKGQSAVLGASAPSYNQRPDQHDFQMRTYANNEELRANQFGALKSFGAGLGKLAANTTFDILGAAGTLAAGIPSAIASGDANQIFDNSVSTALNDAQEYMNDEIFPIYNSIKDKDKNILHRALTDLEFWTDDIMGEGVPFILSSWLTAYAGVGALRPLTKAKYLSSINAARGLGAEATGAIAKNLAKTEQVAAAFMSRTVEGMVEARDTRNQVYEQLIAKGLSPDEASAEAGKAAMATFGLNYALMPIEYIQAGSWFKAFGKSREALLQSTKKGLAIPKRYALNKTAQEVGVNMITEGPIEENFQKAVQDYVYERFTGNSRDEVLPWESELSNGISGLFSRMGENFTTKEGWDAIGTGSILGGLFGGAATAFSANSKEQKERLKNVKGNIDLFNSDKEAVNKRVTNIIESIKGFDTLDKLSKTQQIKNKENFWNVFESLKFGEYAFANFEAGLGSRLEDQINEMENSSDEEFMSGYKDKTKVDELRDKATKYESLYNMITDRFQIPDTDAGRRIKQSLYREAILQDALNSEIEKAQPRIDEMKEKLRPTDEYGQIITDKNSLVRENAALNRTIADIESSPDEQWKSKFGSKIVKKLKSEVNHNKKLIGKLNKARDQFKELNPDFVRPRTVQSKILKDQYKVEEKNLLELTTAAKASAARYDLLANPDTQNQVAGFMQAAQEQNEANKNAITNAAAEQAKVQTATQVAAETNKPVDKVLSNKAQIGDQIVGTRKDDGTQIKGQVSEVNPDGSIKSIKSNGTTVPVSNVDNVTVTKKLAEEAVPKGLEDTGEVPAWLDVDSMFGDEVTPPGLEAMFEEPATPAPTQDTEPEEQATDNSEDDLEDEPRLFEDRKRKTNEYSLAGLDIDYTVAGTNLIDRYDSRGNLVRGDQAEFYDYVNNPLTDLKGVTGILWLVDSEGFNVSELEGSNSDSVHIRFALPNGLATSIHTVEFIKNNIAGITPERIEEFKKWRKTVVELIKSAGDSIPLTITSKGPGALLRNEPIGGKRSRRKLSNLLDVNSTPIGATIKSKKGEEHVTRLYDWKGAATPPVVELYGVGKSGRVYVGVPAANDVLTPVPVYSRNLSEQEAKLVIAAIRKRFEGKNYETVPGSTWTYNDIIRFYVYPSSSVKANDLFISDSEQIVRIGSQRYGSADILSYPAPLVAALMGKIHQVQNKRLIRNEEVPIFSLKSDNNIVVDSTTRYREYLFNSVLETDMQPVNGNFFGQPTINYDPSSIYPTEPEAASTESQDQEAKDIRNVLLDDDDPFNLPALKKLTPAMFLDGQMTEMNSFNEKEMLEVMKLLPQVPVKVVREIIKIQQTYPAAFGAPELVTNISAVGSFHKGLITIYENAPKGTVYHEAFHAVFRMMLSSQERDDILREQAKITKPVREKINYRGYKLSGTRSNIPTWEIFKNAPNTNFGPKDYTFKSTYAEDVDINSIVPTQEYVGSEFVGGENYIPTAYKVKGKYYLTDGHHRISDAIRNGATTVRLWVNSTEDAPISNRLKLEEELAERFEQYMLSDGKIDVPTETRNFFERLWDMIKTFVLNLFGKVTPEQIFRRIKTGYYTNFDGDPNRFTSAAPKEYNFSPMEEVYFMNYFTRQLFGGMFRNLEKFDATDAESVGIINQDIADIYNGIKTKLQAAADTSKGDIKAKYEHAVNKFDSLVKSHQLWMEKYKLYVPDTDYNPEEEILKLKDQFSSREATEFSAKDNAMYMVKLFVAALPKLTVEDGKVVENVDPILGLPQVTDYSETWNFLLDKLSGSSSVDEIITRLSPYYDIKPELRIISNMLSKQGLPYQEIFKTQFLQAFAKFNTTPVTTLFTYDNEGKLVASTLGSDQQNLKAIIRSEWQGNFINSDLVDIDPMSRVDDYISKNDVIERIANEYLTTIRKSKNPVPSTIEALGRFGISFTKGAVESWAKVEGNKIEEFNAAARYILTRLASPSLKDKFELFTGFNEASNLDFLADIEAKFNPSILEAVHLNPENKPTYHYIQNNFLSTIIGDLKRGDTSYVNKILNSYYGANSRWAAAMKAGVKPEIRLLEGARLEGFRGKLTTALTPGMWIATRINNVLQDKPIFAVLRPAEKKSEYGLVGFEALKSGVVRNKDGQGLTAIDINSKEVLDQFYGYFEDEYKRTMYAYLKQRKRENADIPGSLLEYLGLGSEDDINTDTLTPFDVRGQKMTFFGPIISSTDVELFHLLENFHRPSKDEIERIRLAIKNYLLSQINRTFDYLNDQSLIKVVDSEGSYKTSRTDTYKQLKQEGTSLNIENVLIGKEQLKRYAGDVFAAVADFSVNEMMSTFEYIKLTMGDPAFYKDFFKRTPLVTGTGKSVRIDKQVAQDINPEYSKLRQKYAATKTKAEVEAGVLKLAVVKSVKRNSSQLGEFKSQLESLKLSKAEIDKILAGYKNYDESDAFSWITPQAAREFLMRIGDWNPDLESTYQNIMSGNQVKYKKLKNFLTAIKLMGAGPIDINDNHVMPMAYLKTATMPILPNAVKGRELENHLERMYRSGADMVIVDSGSKGASYEVQDMYEPNGTINSDSPLKIANFNFKYLKLQIDVQQKAKNKVIFGTQMRKLIFSNIFKYNPDGDLVEKEFTINGVPTKTKALWERFNSIYSKLTQRYKDSLVNELGIVYDFDNDTYTVVDWTKMVDKIKAEAQGRQYPKSVVESIRINAEGNGLDIPGDALTNRRSIENMMNALVYNRVIAQKMNGSSSVQIPVTGFEIIGSTDKVVDSTGELKFINYNTSTGQVMEAEVYLPHSFRNKYGYLNDLKIEDVDPEALKFIGFRIPTEGLRSIIKIKVKGFLPAEMGQVVVVPSELVAQAGSDFDIDKLNILQPHYKWNDDTKKIERVSSEEDTIEGLENSILDIVNGLLSHKDTFVSSLRPTGEVVDAMKELATDIKRLKGDTSSKEENPLSIIEFDKKMDIAYKFIAGKDGVGVAALHNTHHVLSQAANLKLTKDASELLSFKHNKSKDGKSLLSGMKDVEGKYEISDILAASVNGFVDIVKDPFIVELFTDLNTAGIGLTMIRLGAPIGWVTKFINQPLIQRYIRNKEFAASEVGKITKLSPRKVLQELREQYYNRLDEASKTLVDRDTWTLTSPMFRNLSEAQLENYIDIGYEDGVVTDSQADINNNKFGISANEYYLSQISLLNDYLAYDKLTSKMRLLIANTASDTFHAKTFNDVDRFVRRKEQIGIDEVEDRLDTVFDNYQDLFITLEGRPTFVQSFYANGLRLEHRAFNKLFPIRQSGVLADGLVQSGSVQSAVRKVEALVGKTNRLRDYEIEKVSDGLMGYIAYKSISKQEIADFVLDTYTVPAERLLVSNKMKFNLTRNKTGGKFIKKGAYYKVGDKLNLNGVYSVQITSVKKYSPKELTKLLGEDEAKLLGLKYYKKPVFLYESKLIKNSLKTKSEIRSIHELKTSPADSELHKELQSNPFFMNLRVYFSRKAGGVNSLRFRARPTDNIVHEDLVEHWRRMFNSTNPVIRNLANKIAKYAIYQSGLRQSNISFFKYIPPEEFSKIINASLTQFDDNLDSPEVLNMLFKNIWKDDAFVPKLNFSSQYVMITNDKGDLIGIRLRSSVAANERYFKGSPPPFLKFSDGRGGFNLVELVGFAEERQSGDAIYQLTNKLGDGTYLTEFHEGPSIYEDNNEYIEGIEILHDQVTSSVSYWKVSPLLIPPMIEEAIAPKSDSYSQIEAESNDTHNVDTSHVDDGSNDDFGFMDGDWIDNMFGQLTPSDQRPPDDNLNKILRAKLAEIGVQVIDVDRIITKAGSVVAVAKTLESVINIAKGKADITTLPEEAAHMFISMLDPNNPLLQKMMKDITSYNLYKEVRAEYYDAYNGDENKIKLEAIGKLIGNIIVNDFTGETTANIEKAKNWWNRVWEVVKKLLAKIGITELEEYTRNSPSIFKQFAMDITSKRTNKTLSEAIVANNFESISLSLQNRGLLKKKCS
jgi:hypothetical protein